MIELQKLVDTYQILHFFIGDNDFLFSSCNKFTILHYNFHSESKICCGKIDL